MKLNRAEFAVVNNRIMNSLQEKTKIRQARYMADLPKNTIALEIGCGNGYESKSIMKHFSPKRLYATDLDEKMINLAKKNFKDPSIKFEVADASKLKYEDNFFDAIFSFGVIHHIPNWKDSIKELKRVLRPGGHMVIEELSKESFETATGKVMEKLFEHPYDEMFRPDEFVEYMKKNDFKILKYEKHSPIWTLKYFIVIAKN